MSIADDDAPLGESNIIAGVTTSKFYQDAQIEFSRSCLPTGNNTTPEFDETIVHELLHIIMRDNAETFSDAVGDLSPSSQVAFNLRWKAANEGIIEHLTRRIVALHWKS